MAAMAENETTVTSPSQSGRGMEFDVVAFYIMVLKGQRRSQRQSQAVDRR